MEWLVGALGGGIFIWILAKLADSKHEPIRNETKTKQEEMPPLNIRKIKERGVELYQKFNEAKKQIPTEAAEKLHRHWDWNYREPFKEDNYEDQIIRAFKSCEELLKSWVTIHEIAQANTQQTRNEVADRIIALANGLRFDPKNALLVMHLLSVACEIKEQVYAPLKPMLKDKEEQ